MEFVKIADNLKKEFAIKSVVLLNKEDGDVIETWGNENQLLNDAGAFLGSAGEIIFKKLSLTDLKFISIKSKDDIIIINRENDFLAFIFSEKQDEQNFYSKFLELTKEIVIPKDEPSEVPDEIAAGSDMGDLLDAANAIEEEDKLSDMERKLFNAKISQINFLINEFAISGEKAKWVNVVKEGISSMEKIILALDIADDIKLKSIITVPISKEEIQKDSKEIIDTLCKLAVKEFGAKDAKQKVQNVILKLNKR